MAKKIKKYKVGIDSETYAISMVECPAIESDFVALEKEEEQKVFLQKEEKFMVYGAALIPDKDIYRNDGEQEFYISFTKESIEKMSQDFMKEYRQHNVTLDHNTDATDVTVVESWLKADETYDKSVAIGLDKDLPLGTWFVGMKVNQIDVWERIKKGELKGFSVESMISLEEFEKQSNTDMIETNENFWTKLKNVLSDVFKSASMPEREELAADSNSAVDDEVENNIKALEAELEEQIADEPNQEPVVDTIEVVEEPEPQTEPEPIAEPEPQVEPQPNPLEELVRNLQEEIKALRESNNALNEKVKDLGKKPSVNPINTNAKPSANDSYSAWREQMRQML